MTEATQAIDEAHHAQRNIRQRIFTRRWLNINKNRAHMEELILKLMENPATEPEHMAQAHAMYSDICNALSRASYVVENVIRTGVVPKDALSMYPKIRQITCACGETYSVIEDAKWHRCPACGML